MADEEQKKESAPGAAAEEVDVASLTEKMLAHTDVKELISDDNRERADLLLQTIIDYVDPTLEVEDIDVKFLDSALEKIDSLISSQLDQIMHHPDFQKLESAWRGLYWLVGRTDFSQNIKLELLQATKDELLDDFKDCGGDTKLSGLYKHLYDSAYGTPNGKPFGAMVLNYEFAHGEKDVSLLSYVAEVASMSHSPVIGGVSGELFGPKGFDHLSDIDYSVKDALAGKEYAKWNGFREDENSRYVGLVLPHFLLRTPYNADHPDAAKEFTYTEQPAGKAENYLWGNAAFTFASRLTDSFAKYRWCWRIVGEESGGMVDRLSMHTYVENGETVQKPPTDVRIAHAKEKQLSDQGMIPLAWLQGKDQAVFYGAQSMGMPRIYPDTPEGNKKEADDKIRTRLPYMFILSRFAHYIKRKQTKYIGKPTSAAAISKELNEWIMQYVNKVDNPQNVGRRPLYDAGVTVEEDKRNPGVFLCDFWMIPHKMPTGFKTRLRLVTQQDLSK